MSREKKGGGAPRRARPITNDPRTRRAPRAASEPRATVAGGVTRGARAHGPARKATEPSRAARAARPTRTSAQAAAVHPVSSRTLRRRPARRIRPVRHRVRPGLSRRRLRAVFMVSAMTLLYVVYSVARLQTADADSLRAAGKDQRTTESVLPAKRGVIFDRDGNELALSVPAKTIIANPKLVGDEEGTVRTLAPLLDLGADKQQSLLTALGDKSKGFWYVARQVPDDTAAAVKNLALAGISIIDEDRRSLPAGEVGKGVIGRTDSFGVGIAGLELQYDDLLTGTDGERVRERGVNGESLPGGGTTTVQPIPGDDLVLTIDRSIQYALEQALLAQASKLGARGATGVIMHTRTGEVLGMAGVRKNDEGVHQVTNGNLAVVDADEPGSVTKAITISAALNEGSVTPDSVFRVAYQEKFSDTMLHDAEVHATKDMTVAEILIDSSNIGTIKTMLSMEDIPRGVSPYERQGSYMTAFGLGQKTALNFPGESSGIFKPWYQFEGAEKYTMAYGQGVAATSIQLVAAMNVIANGGVYIAPSLVKGTIGADGTMTPAAPSATREVIRPEVAQTMNLLMREVVCSGTATRAQVQGLTVAGKTGTGLKAMATGGYLDEDGQRSYFSSFIGFFPAEDPQVTVLISVDEPPADSDNRFGGTAAAPVFAKLAPTIMHELDLTPPTPNGGCPKPAR